MADEKLHGWRLVTIWLAGIGLSLCAWWGIAVFASWLVEKLS